MMEVYKAIGELEAQIIKSLLDSYGIPSMLQSNAASSVHSFVFDSMGEVKVMVPDMFAEEAKALIYSENTSDSQDRQV
ncbi:MAG: DUF2007 domain-containing protein [Dehalococcoidales bacterium]|jgi:hypothetical protein|nr:DUF2007 domain-containing protein [Dehalococcoidales bacterium]